MADVYIVIAICFWVYLMHSTKSVVGKGLFTLAALFWPIFTVLFCIGIVIDSGDRK